METVKKRNPFVALLLSLIATGLGQVYNGQIGKGALFFAIILLRDAVNLLVIGSNPSVVMTLSFWIISLLVGLTLIIGIALEAFFTARRQTEYALRPFNRWYVYLLVFIAAFAFGRVKSDYVNTTLIPGKLLAGHVNAVRIRSAAMSPTLAEGDYLMADTQYFRNHPVQRGDLVLFKASDAALTAEEKANKEVKDYVKRCVAVAGDTVEIKDKVLFVNKQKVDEKYIQLADPKVFPAVKLFPTAGQYQQAWESGKFADLPYDSVRDNFGPVVVPVGSIFALGDNRDKSFDSRFWGPVNSSLLKGKPALLYFSKDLKKIGRL